MGAARNLEQDQAAFNDKQLSSLEEIAGSKPGEVLDKAVGIIDEATREAIKKAMPGHEAIFQKNLEKAGDGPAAFKRAFRATYGRFLMERGGAKYKMKVVKDGGGAEDTETDLEDKDGFLMKRLGKVLKFPIEDGLGLKGRTELIAAVGRLRMLGLETNLGKGELENVAKLKSEKEAETVIQDKVNFLTTANPKLANVKKMSAEIYAINPVGPDADTISDRFINEVEPLVNSLDALSAAKIPDSLKGSNLVQKYEMCVKGVAAVQRNIDRPNSPGAIQMALNVLMGNLRALNAEIESEAAKGNTELAAKKFEIGKIEKSTKGTLVAKIIGKIDKEIEQIDKDLAKPDIKDKDKTELSNRKTKLQLQRLNPVEWVVDKSFPEPQSGTEMKRLERLHHEDEHKEHELQDVYKYFSGHDSFTKVVEISGQLEGAITDWESDREKGVKKIGKQSKGLNKQLGGLPNVAEEEKKIYGEKAKDIEDLEKKKEKAGLGMNARLSYLKEQIVLKEKSTLSDAEIEKLLNERGKGKDQKAWEEERKRERKRMEEENQKKAEERGEMKEELERLNLIIAKSKEFRAELARLIDNAVKAEHLGIDLKKHVGEAATKEHDVHEHHEHPKDDHKDSHGHVDGIAAGMLAKLQGINLDNRNFDPSSLVSLYKEFNGLFGDGHRIQSLLEEFDKASADKAEETKKSKKALDRATASAEKGKHLTDADAAKKIIGTMVGLEFPDLSPMEHNKLVTMILANDVATLQTDEGYESLAQRGSAENLKVVGAAFRAKLISFKFKEGEKVTQPFKGLKPDDFKDWASVEKLFLRGKLNYKNAFFVLAAFEDFDNGVKSIQAVQLEKKLKKLLAKELGVDEHMDKAGLSKIVDDAFKAQMEKVRPIMKAHNDLVKDKGGEAKGNKKKVLDMKYEELNDQLRTKKIGREIYENKLKALIKEAAESDVEVEFSADSTAAQFWNSPQAQWLRDKAHDASVLVGKKALAAAVFAPAKILGKGAWGATKLGASLGFQGAMLPLRAAKYPLLLAAKPVVGLINLFRSNKWTPLPGIRASLNNDVGRVMGYATEKATGVVKGSAETVSKTTSAEWDKVKYTDTKYEDRRKHHTDERAELLKIHESKSELDAIDVAESPFISFDRYKKQVDMVATALGIKVEAPSGHHEVKVGHEEAAKKEEAPHAAPAHGAEAKKEEPAHGADAHAHHEEPKKAAGHH
jgi:hypothetical protein